MDLPAPELEPLFRAVCAELEAHGTRADRMTVLAAGRETLEDDPTKYLLSRGRRPVAVVLRSPSAAPDIVARGAARAAEARARLGPDLGRVVLEPLAQGLWEGRSWAAVPWKRPLSFHPLRWRIQRRRLGPHLLGWLDRAVATTRAVVPVSERERVVRAPLEALAADPALPAGLRSDARAALGRLASGTFAPLHVLSHNDLWRGNVLLPRDAADRRACPHGFYLIDWAGSRPRGFPFLDLGRLALSLDLEGPRLRRAVAGQCRALGCEPDEAASHLACGLAEAASDLDQWPIEAFRALATRVHERLAPCLGAGDA